MFALPDPEPPQIWLVAGDHGLNDLMIEFAARLVLRAALQEQAVVAGETNSAASGAPTGLNTASPGALVHVLDAGNGFNAHKCSRLLAHYLSGAGLDWVAPGRGEAQSRSGRYPDTRRFSLSSLLERVRVARAFTCYQVHTLLAQTPTSPHPTLVLDILSTFYDEDVPLPEMRRLFQECLGHLQRLCQLAPVVVSARPPDPEAASAAERSSLLELLASSAQRTISLQTPAPVDPQMSFGI